MRCLLIGLPPDTQMHRFTSNGSERRLGDDGVLLGQGLAQRLGIRVGDLIAITLQQNGIRFQQRVAGFVNEPMSPVGYIAGDQLSRFVPPSGVMVKLTPGTPADILREKVTATPGVIAYLTTESVQTTIRDAFSLYNALVGLMLAFAGVMAAALLYNAMSANIGERTGELSTLQAAGMGPGLLGRLVATENLMLVLVGLPIGLVAATRVADWFMSTYQTQGYRWHLDMQATTPLIVAARCSLPRYWPRSRLSAQSLGWTSQRQSANAHCDPAAAAAGDRGSPSSPAPTASGAAASNWFDPSARKASSNEATISPTLSYPERRDERFQCRLGRLADHPRRRPGDRGAASETARGTRGARPQVVPVLCRALPKRARRPDPPARSHDTATRPQAGSDVALR